MIKETGEGGFIWFAFFFFLNMARDIQTRALLFQLVTQQNMDVMLVQKKKKTGKDFWTKDGLKTVDVSKASFCSYFESHYQQVEIKGLYNNDPKNRAPVKS